MGAIFLGNVVVTVTITHSYRVIFCVKLFPWCRLCLLPCGRKSFVRLLLLGESHFFYQSGLFIFDATKTLTKKCGFAYCFTSVLVPIARYERDGCVAKGDRRIGHREQKC